MPEESKLTEKLKEKENQKQFSKEEMEKLRSIQDGYSNIRGEFGQLHMSRIRLNEQLTSLNDLEADISQRFQDLQTDEKKFLDETTKKYGQGSLDPESGMFTPSVEQDIIK